MAARANEIRLSVMGAGGVGKSACVIRYVSGHFVEEYDPGIEDSFRKAVMVNEQMVMLEILDNCYGIDEFPLLVTQAIRDFDGVILAYAINDARSLEDLENVYWRLIERERDGARMPMLVLGCKSDLEDGRQVTLDMAKEVASRFVFDEPAEVPVMECSAKMDEGVEEAYLALAQSIMEAREGGKKKREPTPCVVM